MENKEELATKLLNVSLKATNDKGLNLEEKSVVYILVNKILTIGYDNAMGELLHEEKFYEGFGFTYNYPTLVTKFLMSNYFNEIREILNGGEK